MMFRAPVPAARWCIGLLGPITNSYVFIAYCMDAIFSVYAQLRVCRTDLQILPWELTAIRQLACSWIWGATSRRGMKGEGKEGMKRKLEVKRRKRLVKTSREINFWLRLWQRVRLTQRLWCQRQSTLCHQETHVNAAWCWNSFLPCDQFILSTSSIGFRPRIACRI